MRRITTLLFSLMIPALLILPAQPAHADVELGYLWSLEFDFENSFDGVLKIEVGPWEYGDLLSVDETSTEHIPCRPVGAVSLDNGDAVFSGGHLACELDLAAIILKNHGLMVDKIDSYGTILLHTDVSASVLNIAPIVSHPDATYLIDFTQPTSVTLAQVLNNKSGTQKASFMTTVGPIRHKYSFEYGCVWEGPCHSTFAFDTNGVVVPAIGSQAQFHTGPVVLLIGGDGTTTFSGRMGSLLIDPGNSVH